MGLMKWLFKNGIGSVGSSAKEWTKIYLSAISSMPQEATLEQSFLHLILLYQSSNKKLIKYEETDRALLIHKSNQCLALLMWNLILELPDNVKAFIKKDGSVDEKAFIDASEAVYESVKVTSSKNIKLNLEIFKQNAREILNYRILALLVLAYNGGVNKISFYVIVLQRNDGFGLDSYQFLDFQDALNHFSESIILNRNNLASYSHAIVEKNSEKYVFVHNSTDTNFTNAMNSEVAKTAGQLKLRGIDDFPSGSIFDKASQKLISKSKLSAEQIREIEKYGMLLTPID